MVPGQEGTSGVNINRRARRVKVSADGIGLVSRAGTLLLRELTVETGLAAEWTEALLDTYRAAPCLAGSAPSPTSSRASRPTCGCRPPPWRSSSSAGAGAGGPGGDDR